MKALTENTMFARCLGWLAKMVMRHRRLVFVSQVLLFVASILVTLKYPGIEFDTRRDNLVGSNQKYHENYLKFRKEFPQQDDLVVIVESDDAEKNRQFVERLATKLENDSIEIEINGKRVRTNVFTDVFYKGDLALMGNKGLLFLPEKDLLDFKSTLKSYEPFVKQFVQTTNLNSLFNMINRQIYKSKNGPTSDTEALVGALPALQGIIAQARNSLLRRGVPPSPGVTALFDPDGKANQSIYISFPNTMGSGWIFLLTAHAPNDELNGAAVDRLRKIMERTKPEVPGVNVGLTGGPVLELDEMLQSQKDTTKASIVSLILCAMIFIFGYQQVGRPVKATLCLLVGLSYTMGFATLVVGHLNILTITFLPMLIGLAIDFGVHLVTRFEEELQKGHSKEEALTTAMVFTGQGIFTGAFTTAGAFLAMGFTDFKGIREMGIICGGGLLVCLVPMMMLLPVLLLRGRQNELDATRHAKPEFRARLEQIWLRRPGWVTVILVVSCGLSLTQIPKLFFDYDLLHMQSQSLPSVVYEQKLINSTSRSVLYAVVIATNAEQSVDLIARLQKLPSVATNGIETIGQYLAGDQTQQLATIGEIKEMMMPLKFGEVDVSPVVMSNLSATLYSTFGYLGNFLGTNIPPEEVVLRTNIIRLRDAIAALRWELNHGTPVQLVTKAAKLGSFQQALFNDLQNTFQALRTQDNSAPLRIQDLPQSLRNRFVGVHSNLLLQVYPKYDVWQRDHQEQFVKEVASVYPNATGTPSELYEYTSLLKDSYQLAALYSLGAIIFLVFIHFRSIGSVILSLIPVLIGSLWLCGLMGFFQIPFNPANIMTLPLVIGIGVTNGIQILNRYAEEQTPSILGKSTGKAVLVSGLTTIVGFGSLILAEHRGIESLGLIMAIGVTACMVAALIFLPALLNIFMSRSKK